MEFKISRKNAYLAMFYYVESYARCEEPLHDDLCSLLGGWMSNLELGYLSWDQGVYSEWKDVIRDKMNNLEFFSKDDLFNAIIYFLEYHLQYTYNLEWLIEDIKKDYLGKDKWDFLTDKILDFIINATKSEDLITME